MLYLDRIVSSHSLHLTLGGMLVASLIFNWIAIRRSSSIFVVFWGLVPYLVVAISTYSAILSIDCDPPEACEWSALGYILSLFIYSACALLYLPIALRIRAIFRKRQGTEQSASKHLLDDLQEGGLLLAGALLGLIVGVLFAVVLNSGLLVRWERLEIPREIPTKVGVPAHQVSPSTTTELVEQILFGSQTGLFVRTDRERVLSVRFPDHDAPKEERELTWLVETGPPISEKRAYETGCPLQYVVLPPPGRVKDRVRSRHCDGFDLQQAEYAILEDGSLWAWHEIVRLYSFLQLAVIAGPLGGLFIIQAKLLRKTEVEDNITQEAQNPEG